MDFLSSEDVGERLGVTRQQVQKLAKMGRIPHVWHGRKLRFPVAAWEQWLASQREQAMASVRQEIENAH